MSTTDPLGRVTSFEHDNLGRVILTTLHDPDGAGELTAPQISATYDAAGNLTSQTDPRLALGPFARSKFSRINIQGGADTPHSKDYGFVRR